MLAPACHLHDDRVARLVAAVDAGATLVLGPRALVRDTEGAWLDAALPGTFAGLAGASVDHAGSPTGWPREPAAPARIACADETFEAGPWVETFDAHDDGVEIVMRSVGGPLDGRPVVVRRGALVLCGVSSREAWTALLARLTGMAPQPTGQEVFVRDGRALVVDHEALEVRAQVFRNPVDKES